MEGALHGLLDLDLELVLVPNKIEDLSTKEIEGPQKRRFAELCRERKTESGPRRARPAQKGQKM